MKQFWPNGWVILTGQTFILQEHDRIFSLGEKKDFLSPHTIVAKPGYHGETVNSVFGEKWYATYFVLRNIHGRESSHKTKSLPLPLP